MRSISFALLLAWVAFLGARSAAAVPASSLYERLGGEARVSAFVSETIDRTADHPRLGRSFYKIDRERVKQLLVEQICSLAGGGCEYTGDSMVDVHAGLDLTEADLYGLVEILREAMIRQGVGQRARNELLEIFAPMKREVVTR